MRHPLRSWTAILLGVGFAGLGTIGVPAPLALASLTSIGVGAGLLLVARRASNRAIAVTVAASILLTLCAFGVVVTCEVRLGGTTANGRVENGRYYLGSHGRYHEVDLTTYRAVMVPELVVAALWPALLWLLAAEGPYSRNLRIHPPPERR